MYSFIYVISVYLSSKALQGQSSIGKKSRKTFPANSVVLVLKVKSDYRKFFQLLLHKDFYLKHGLLYY